MESPLLEKLFKIKMIIDSIGFYFILSKPCFPSCLTVCVNVTIDARAGTCWMNACRQFFDVL